MIKCFICRPGGCVSCGFGGFSWKDVFYLQSVTGISIELWRAAVGLFVKNSKHLKLMPRHMFFDKFNPNFSYSRRAWSKKLFGPHFSKRGFEYTGLGIAGLCLIIQMLLICAGIHPNPGPISQDHRVISICHANIRSLKHVDKFGIYDKLMHIKCNLVKNFKIVTLSETWLTSDDSSDRFMIPGFQKPFRRDRDANTGIVGYGGVLPWVHDTIACKRRLDQELPTTEAMWLVVRVKK